MDAIVKQFFDKKVGDFLKVDEGNLRVDASTGQFLLKNASIVGQAFDGLHLPVSLRGGFIDELSVHLHLDVFNPGSNVSLQILIKNVFLVFGAHTTDWSYSHVKQCKSKLVDLIMKILELKPPRKAKAAAAAPDSATGWLGDMQERLKQDLLKKIFEMIEVNITNFHVRFEDSKTQPVPYACGFKLGYCAVFATEDVNSQRTTGTWRHTVDTLADPLFSQTIVARRMSVYWDLDQGHRHFTSIPSGEEVFARFKRLNLRETFSACVVEKLLELYPSQHPRRKYMQGPTFRERLDYHQYIIFPAGLNAHITANKSSEATKIQKAPLRDADVVVYSLDVAIDSEQLRSVNSLLSYVKNFALKDTLILSRPSQTISAVRGSARRDLVRAWWQHAKRAVQIICKIPKREISPAELQNRGTVRENYISAVNHAEELDVLVRAGQEDARKHALAMEKVADMQMTLRLKEILDWRMQARDRSLARDSIGSPSPTESVKNVEDSSENKSSRLKDRPLPQTLQVKVTFLGFQVFFLVSQDGFWYTKCKPGTLVDEERPEDIEPERKRKRMHTRQPVVSASIKNIVLEVIQKGHKNIRVARWIEVSVGRLEVVNLNAGVQQPSRNIVNIQPIQKHKGLPICLFLGLNTFELTDPSFVNGDTPLAAVLEPWEGLLGHTKDKFSSVTPVMLQNLGFLKEQINDLGKLMTFVFARVGEVKAIDWAPFRRRMLFFTKRGLHDMDLVTDLARRPSQEALMKELLVNLQRKVELAVGKSNMLGSFEVEFDGIQARTVDHYNKGMVLCKLAQLSPLMFKMRRSGQPQALQVQIHHLHPDVLSAPSLTMLMNGGVNMLPWKTSMMLLPQDNFHCTAGSDGKLGKDRKGREKQEKEAKENRKGLRGGALVPKTQSSQIMSRSEAPGVQAEFQGLDSSLQGLERLKPMEGTFFLKWGRNGRAKRRFVEYDERLKALVWKDNAAAKPRGVFPLGNIQDVVTGMQTPITQQADLPSSCCYPKGGYRFNPNLVISVIAEDRTLDLQAETAQQHQLWAEGIVARFRAYLQSQSADDPAAIIAFRYSSYPPKFRSDRCELRLACERLQAMTSFNKTVEVMRGAAEPSRHCHSCGLPLELLTSSCGHCGAPPEEASA